ncbi:hypothetical protein AKJ09_00769 [Labilithrix luteola]|uniref:Uncharacterized protein n=1 Tax=Labilithrix luteola TaxID=1391654 RepID=A0A0K1PKQ3_9BACT|nr:hypothetical protein [Labilithrix luteola]AKU94105.1 hypothetical protein AKJ09_00769 [Labilithrix luteola]
MFETAGLLRIAEPSASLVWLVVLPLLWAAFAFASAIFGVRRQSVRAVALAASSGILVLSTFEAIRLAELGPGRVIEQHVATLVRLGQLDLSIDLAADFGAIAFTILVGILAVASVIRSYADVDRARPTSLGWTGILVAASLLVLLAAAWPLVLVGLGLATVAAWGMTGAPGVSRVATALTGDGLALFGFVLLFWSLGGTFGGGGFDPDARPRFALVAIPDVTVPDGKSTVSMSTYAGAFVTSDDGPPLPGEPLRSPFTVTLEPGVHSFEIDAGSAVSQLLVTHVTLAAGRAYALAPFGPTTSFRNLADQLAVARPNVSSPSTARVTLGEHLLFGVRTSTFVVLLVALGALLRLVASAAAHAQNPFEAIVAFALVSRVALLIDKDGLGALALLGSAFALLFALDAASRHHVRGVFGSVLAAAAALSIACLGGAGTSASFVILGSVALASFAATIEVDADVRWLGVAGAAMAGLLPFTGAFAGYASLAGSLLVGARTGSLAFGVSALFLGLTVVSVSYVCFRMYDAGVPPSALGAEERVRRDNQKRDQKRDQGRVASALQIGLAAGALFGGALLGAGTSPYGGRVVPLVQRVFGDVSLAPSTGIATAAAFFALACAVVGLVVARSSPGATGAGETGPGWLRAVVTSPAALFARATGIGRSSAGFLASSVDAMDRDVIDDVFFAFGRSVLVVASGVRRAERVFGGAAAAEAEGRSGPSRVRWGSRVVSQFEDRLGLDNPRIAERLRFVLLFVMVALLGLILLFAVLLG